MKESLHETIRQAIMPFSPDRLVRQFKSAAESDSQRFKWLKAAYAKAAGIHVSLDETGRPDVFDEDGTCMIRPSALSGAVLGANGLYTLAAGATAVFQFGGPSSALSRTIGLWDIEIVPITVGVAAWTPSVKMPLVGYTLKRTNQKTMIIPDSGGSGAFPLSRFIRNPYNPAQFAETRNPLGIVDAQNAVELSIINVDGADAVVFAIVGMSQQPGN